MDRFRKLKSTTGTAQDALTSRAADPETKCGQQIISNPMLPQARIIEPLLKAADVAACLNISRTSAYRLMEHDIPVIRFGISTVRVRLSDLEAFIEKGVSNGC